eukprot:scaffold33712_cov73-Skeletonema_marinoi.AAC.5
MTASQDEAKYLLGALEPATLSLHAPRVSVNESRHQQIWLLSSLAVQPPQAQKSGQMTGCKTCPDAKSGLYDHDTYL